MTETLIVTRHPGLVEFLREDYGIEGEVVPHATPERVAGRHVVGVLPHHLSALALTYSEVPLHLPPELRGKELTVEQVRRYAGELKTYKVTIVKSKLLEEE